jgi:hypothetical protein
MAWGPISIGRFGCGCNGCFPKAFFSALKRQRAQKFLGYRVWQTPRPPMLVNNGNDHFGFNQAALACMDGLPQHHFGTACFFGDGINGQNIVHAGRAFEIQLHAVNHKHQPFSIRIDEIALGAAQAAQIIGAAALKEMQVAGVIDQTGKIGVFIIDPLVQPVAAIDQAAAEGKCISHGCPFKACQEKVVTGFSHQTNENKTIDKLCGSI